MNTQLPLFENFSDTMDAALETVTNVALPDFNYGTFVREVAARTLGQRRGSVILCAAPAGIDCDELVVSLEMEIEARHQEQTGTPFEGIHIVDTPCSYRRKPGAASILETYHHAAETPGLSHSRPPEYQLNFGEAFVLPNQFQRISSLLHRRPSQVYIFKNIHLLQSANGSVGNACDALMTLVEMAAQSKRTHVLIGHSRVVLEWLRNSDIARAVSPCILAPYDLRHKPDCANFLEVIRAYDQILPWADGESLEQHITEVDKVVSGSPSRLRKWLGQALCKAKAERDLHLSWNRVYSARLLPTEQAEAGAELKLVRDSGGDGPAEADTPKAKPEGNTKPGIRKPDRNGLAA
jgi:hypothetical protein